MQWWILCRTCLVANMTSADQVRIGRFHHATLWKHTPESVPRWEFVFHGGLMICARFNARLVWNTVSVVPDVPMIAPTWTKMCA